MNKILIAITIGIATWLAACSAPISPTPLPLPTATQILSTPTLAPQATLPSTSSIVEIGDTDKGKTFLASIGARIQVVLHSTYWQFDNLQDGQAIKQLSTPIVAPDMTVRIPGTGAGTVTVEFQAVASGQINIQASRVTCGEALRCADDQRAWQVTVVVK